MPTDSPAQSLKINYLKSKAYREAACDGALGGPTPQKKLWIAFYTERFPIPRIAEYNVVPASKAGASSSILPPRQPSSKVVKA
jgi:hypothetical protein